MIHRTLTAIALAGIAVYRYGIRPIIGPRCRYFPSCSEYGQEALKRHGWMTGGLLTLMRLARCHPWDAGGLDPVPESPVLRWRRLGRCDDPSCGAHAAMPSSIPSADAQMHAASPTSRH
jgi:putative membrane protein insertion efficiency factor